MLNVLLHGGVGEIVAVSIRYYGGTKLGTGGLTRAYAGGVKLLLETLPTEEKEAAADDPVLLRAPRFGDRGAVEPVSPSELPADRRITLKDGLIAEDERISG